MQVAEIKDYCANARKHFSSGDKDGALLLLEKVFSEMSASNLESHPLTAVCWALKGEILQSIDGSQKHAADQCMVEAKRLCEQSLEDDFENVAPVLLNIVRYFITADQTVAAKRCAKILIAGSEAYYEPAHPRTFQLRRWLEEAGCSL